MKKPITLIAPPRYEKAPDLFLPQNLGLGYIASFLESQGYGVTIIDALAQGWGNRRHACEKGIFIRGLSFEEILASIPEDSALIGITVPFASSVRLVGELTAFLKKDRADRIIVLGGISPSIDPNHALRSGAADYIVRGPGEKPLLALLSGESSEKIQGLVFKNGPHLIDNGSAEMIKDLDSMPFPARHLLPMQIYLTISGRGRKDLRTASVLSSRGCHFDCTFCSIHHIYGYKWRGRSAQNVLSEIKMLIEKYRIEHIEFEDDNLTMDKARAEEIFDGLISLPKKITWSTPNGIRIDTLTRGLLQKMKQSGCTTLFLSIESGDPDILSAMKKRLDLKKVEEVVSACGDLGINSNGVFIVGYPGETAESFMKTVFYIKKLRGLGLVGVGASIAKAYPGTELRRICEKQNYLIDKDRYTKGWPLGEYVDIVTDYFSEQDIFYRLDYIKRRLNPLRFYVDIVGLTKFIKWIIPQWLIDRIKKKIYSRFGVNKKNIFNHESA